MSDASEELHPKHGARFVLEREREGAPRPGERAYRIRVYLAGGQRFEGRLEWDEEGKARPRLEGDRTPPAWVLDELEKQARVLKRDPKAKLSRWREG